jgi:hypothetical protein
MTIRVQVELVGEDDARPGGGTPDKFVSGMPPNIAAAWTHARTETAERRMTRRIRVDAEHKPIDGTAIDMWLIHAALAADMV